MLTSEGVLNADQLTFLRGVLGNHVGGVCILSGGYVALEPFFIQGPTSAGAGFAAAGAAKELLKEGAQEARELLHTGVTGLQTLWGKAPSRQTLKEKLSALPPQLRGDDA